MMETIYIAPGYNQCRVYLIPYELKTGQSPLDIDEAFRRDWVEIGLLNSQLKLVCIETAYSHLAEHIEGNMGGTYFKLKTLSLTPLDSLL